MKKLFCGVLVVVLCLLSALALAEETMPAEPVADGEAEITVNQAPGTEPALPEATQSPTQEAADEGVRWTYPISLSTLQSPYLVLVNKDNLLDAKFEPAKFLKMNIVKRATSAVMYMDDAAGNALKEMFDAAKLVTEYTYQALNSNNEPVEKTAEYREGMTLFLKSAYRSYGTQVTTYTNYLARNNNVDDGYVAKPGASEHQTGLCADILNDDYAGRDRMTQDFKWTAEAQWMKEHCAEFGFILRFLEDKEESTGIKFEPWHFRYVGKEAAGYIMNSGMSFEDFTDEWQFALAEFIGKNGDVDAQIAYELSRLNAPPESVVLDELGEDGDAEVSLVF